MNNSPIIYSKYISKYYKKNIWLKLEILNPTGSHKDRESFRMIKDAKKKGFRSIGCASTGNLALSLAFFSRINKIKCNIWLLKKNADINFIDLLKNLGAKINLSKSKNLKKLYDESNIIMKKRKIFNANPNNSLSKIRANTDIIHEIHKQAKEIDTFATCVNNGSHFLGINNGLKKKDKLIGVFSRSKLAKSINTFTLYEKDTQKIKYINKKNFVEASTKNIIKGLKLLQMEGITCEPSSASVIGSLDKKIFKKRKKICCIISGSAHKGLYEFQKIQKLLS